MINKVNSNAILFSQFVEFIKARREGGVYEPKIILGLFRRVFFHEFAGFRPDQKFHVLFEKTRETRAKTAVSPPKFAPF